MAGGTFDKLGGKIRPGTYINFESQRQETVSPAERGIVLLPLLEHNYGPGGEFIHLSAAAPDAAKHKLGCSIYDNSPSMVLIREAFKCAKEVVVCVLKEGIKASGVSEGLTAEAAYGGSRGNDLRYAVAANPRGGQDVTVYLGTELVARYEGLTSAEELVAQKCPWINFGGTGNLTVTPGVTLAGGEDGKLSNGDVTSFLDAAEGVKWNTLAFALEATGEEGDTAPALYEAVISKIRYLREQAGKYRKAVLPNMAADYEGIINVTNGVVIAYGTKISAAQATAWVAGADAGASNVQSNTYARYAGAVAVLGQKNHAEAEVAIQKGEFFFSVSEAGEVVVEYDINSLVSFKKPKDRTYRKNRVIRVLDSLAEALMEDFPPNKFDNNEDGWGIMEGIGRTRLQQMADAGAIQNVDLEQDFIVDRSTSTGDETYFIVGVAPVDSAEKLYFSIKTR